MSRGRTKAQDAFAGPSRLAAAGLGTGAAALVSTAAFLVLRVGDAPRVGDPIVLASVLALVTAVVMAVAAVIVSVVAKLRHAQPEWCTTLGLVLGIVVLLFGLTWLVTAWTVVTVA